MPCCILYENNYSNVESWENAFFSDCVLFGDFKLKGQHGERDKRIFNLMKNNLNRIQCVGMVMASILSVAGWFCICGVPMLINICKTNITSFEEVRDISMTENRPIAYCVCCSIPCCFAMENKPLEIDVIFSSVITAPVAGGNVNNNNNNNNIVINNPGGGSSKETNAHDVMMAQTLAQQQQFNAMMQMKMLEALNNPGGHHVANPIVIQSAPAPAAPVAEAVTVEASAPVHSK